MDLKFLGEFRTKEELINYFKSLGKKITEEEIDALKQSYNKVQENNDNLTLQQLDEVAGGNVIVVVGESQFEMSKLQASWKFTRNHERNPYLECVDKTNPFCYEIKLINNERLLRLSSCYKFFKYKSKKSEEMPVFKEMLVNENLYDQIAKFAESTTHTVIVFGGHKVKIQKQEDIDENLENKDKDKIQGYYIFPSQIYVVPNEELKLNPDLPNKLHQLKDLNESSLKEPTEQNKENLSENYLKNIVLISGVLLAYSAASVGAIMLNQKSKHKK